MVEIKDKLFEEIFIYLPKWVQKEIFDMDETFFTKLEEIRVRVNKPIVFYLSDKKYVLLKSGQAVDESQNAYIMGNTVINNIIELICRNSVYAYRESISQGFITVKGGHRIGIAGKISNESKRLNFCHITAINIRIAKEVIGCADSIIKNVIKNENDVYNTLIISPPGGGKTTLLRDLSRQLSDGIEDLNFSGLKVGIIDERSEISACWKGIPQVNVGLNTDILDSCPKTKGFEIMLRSLSPQVIIIDEIGNEGDAEAVMTIANAGVRIVASAHGYMVENLKKRKDLNKMMNASIFESFIVLNKMHKMVVG